jgi:hypothetical protein
VVWKIPYKWRFIAGKIIYKWAIFGGELLNNQSNLVGGFEHLLFSPIVDMMIQSDFHIFQGGSNHQSVFFLSFLYLSILS